MFPLSFGRTIEVPVTNGAIKSTMEMVLNKLVERIREKEPRNIDYNERRITFTGGFFRFRGNWNLLVSINYGEIDIVPTSNKILISYKLLFGELFVLASLVTTLFAYFIFSSGFSIQNLGVVAGIWLWFFGVNFIITVVRFHLLVRTASRK